MYAIYLVEDDPFALEALTQQFPWLENGFQLVGSARAPFQALAELEVLHPDVVLSDLKMPELDGIALMCAAQQKGVQAEWIILSAFSEFYEMRDFFREGGFDYLLKPVQNQELTLALEKLSAKLAQRPKQREEPTGNITPSFIELTHYLEQNFQKQHTLDALSKRFALNPNYICSLFHKHYQTTLTRYLTQLRMQHALAMMQTTHKAYKEIASDCGYSD